MLAEYTVPLTLPDGTFAGVAYASFGLERLTDYIKGLDLGEGGYAFLVSGGGSLACYPNREQLTAQYTLQDLAAKLQDPGLTQISEWERSGTREPLPPLRIQDPMTQTPAVAACGRLPRAGWTLCAVMLPTGPPVEAAEGLELVAATVTMLTFLLAVLCDPNGGRIPGLATFAGCLTLVYAGGIGVVWQQGAQSFAGTPMIFAESQIEKVKERHQQKLQAVERGGELITLPTGVLFTEVVPQGQLIDVSGLIWQVLPGGTVSADGTLPPWAGARIANSVDGSQEEVSRVRVDGDLDVVWRFTASVPDETDDDWYPISRRHVRIELVSPTYSEPVLLVPDIGGYDLIVPAARPGISAGLDLKGWTLRRSGFWFKDRQWGADLGLGNSGLGGKMASLNFEAVFELNLLNPLVTYLLPEAVLFVLMFALLLVTSTRPERASRFGQTASVAIATYGTLFFIAVLEHISLREALAASHMVYFESFFIVTYLGLLALTLTALVSAMDDSPWFVEYKDNLISQVVYWPLLTGSLLAITLVVFYS